jgi:hypothetical protein
VADRKGDVNCCGGFNAGGRCPYVATAAASLRVTDGPFTGLILVGMP